VFVDVFNHFVQVADDTRFDAMFRNLATKNSEHIKGMENLFLQKFDAFCDSKLQGWISSLGGQLNGLLESIPPK
jgi:hypothetical protein